MTPRVRLVLSAAAVVAGGLLAAGVIHLAGAKESGLPAVGQVIEDPSAGLAFERHYGIGYPSISDPGDLIAARFGTAAPPATPSTYIIDARGQIAWAWFGATSYSQLDLAVTLATGS
jgi:peroxiredoxin